MGNTQPSMAFASTRAALATSLGAIDGILPGSVVIRHMSCGKASCACKAEPPALHGPYIQWTRTVEGKTLTRYLHAEQLARLQPWLDNARLLKEIVAKLEAASLAAVDQAEGWDKSPKPATVTPPAAKKRHRLDP